MQNARRVGRCNRCEKRTRLTRHHIVPRSEGGNDDETNIELVCWQCHKEIHRAQPQGRQTSKTDRVARKTRIKTFKAQLQFDCKPTYNKCKNCEVICMNFVIELLVIFFQWLDEITRDAYRKPTAVTA
jgi:hypothetical protein